MRILEEGNKVHGCPKTGKLKCRECNTIFEFHERDIQWKSNMWGGEKYYYLRCPNQSCQSEILIHDKRMFFFRWLDYVGGLLQKPRFVK